MIGFGVVTVSRSLGLAAVVAPLLLDAIWPAAAAAVGSLVVLPLATAALFRAAPHSLGLFALRRSGVAFAVLASPLPAIRGSFIGRTLGRDSEGIS